MLRITRPNPLHYRGMSTGKWSVMAGVAGGTYLATLDASIVTVALPFMYRRLGTTLEVIEWVMTAYLVVITGLVLTAGRLGDAFGRRRVYLAGLAVFTLGSAACALAPGIAWLIAARILQAAGGAAVIATGPALITTAFAPYERGKALGIVSTVVAAGLMTGAPLGGLILERFAWPAVFWFTVPFGVAVLAWAGRSLPTDTPAHTRRFDLQGSALLLATLSALLLAVTFGRRDGWSSLETWATGFASLVSLLWLLRAEAETADPVLDLTLLRNPRFTGAALAGLLAFVMAFGVNYLVPFYLTYVRGGPPSEVGAFMTIVPVAMLFFSPVAGALSDRYGTRGLCVVGLTILGGGLLWLAELKAQSSGWALSLCLTAVGTGLAVFQAPNNSALMGSAPPQRLGTAGGMLAMTRNAGMVFGIALAGTLFDARFHAETGHALRALAAGEADVFMAAMRLAFQVGAALTAPAVLASLLKSPQTAHEPPTLF